MRKRLLCAGLLTIVMSTIIMGCGASNKTDSAYAMDSSYETTDAGGYYMGDDLFSEDYQSLVVFYDYSWKNEYAYFNASTGKITYFTDFTYSDEEITKINELIYAKMNMSSKAIKNNYFAYLFEKIENEKESVQ